MDVASAGAGTGSDADAAANPQRQSLYQLQDDDFPMGVSHLKNHPKRRQLAVLVEQNAGEYAVADVKSEWIRPSDGQRIRSMTAILDGIVAALMPPGSKRGHFVAKRNGKWVVIDREPKTLVKVRKMIGQLLKTEINRWPDGSPPFPPTAPEPGQAAVPPQQLHAKTAMSDNDCLHSGKKNRGDATNAIGHVEHDVIMMTKHDDDKPTATETYVQKAEAPRGAGLSLSSSSMSIGSIGMLGEAAMAEDSENQERMVFPTFSSNPPSSPSEIEESTSVDWETWRLLQGAMLPRAEFLRDSSPLLIMLEKGVPIPTIPMPIPSNSSIHGSPKQTTQDDDGSDDEESLYPTANKRPRTFDSPQPMGSDPISNETADRRGRRRLTEATVAQQNREELVDVLDRLSDLAETVVLRTAGRGDGNEKQGDKHHDASQPFDSRWLWMEEATAALTGFLRNEERQQNETGRSKAIDSLDSICRLTSSSFNISPPPPTPPPPTPPPPTPPPPTPPPPVVVLSLLLQVLKEQRHRQHQQQEYDDARLYLAGWKLLHHLMAMVILSSGDDASTAVASHGSSSTILENIDFQLSIMLQFKANAELQREGTKLLRLVLHLQSSSCLPQNDGGDDDGNDGDIASVQQRQRIITVTTTTTTTTKANLKDGICGVILQVMQAHDADVEIQEDGCHVLLLLLLQAEAFPSTATDERRTTVVVLLTAIRQHESHAGIQKVAFLVLGTVLADTRKVGNGNDDDECCYCYFNAAQVTEYDVWGIQKAMTRHENDVNVQENGCWLLGLWYRHHHHHYHKQPTRTQITTRMMRHHDDDCKLILNTMKRHASHPGVQQQGCWALLGVFVVVFLTTASCTDSQANFTASVHHNDGGETATASNDTNIMPVPATAATTNMMLSTTIRMFVDGDVGRSQIATVQQWACRVLGVVVFISPASVLNMDNDIGFSPKIATTIQEAMNRHSKNAAVQESGLFALSAILAKENSPSSLVFSSSTKRRRNVSGMVGSEGTLGANRGKECTGVLEGTEPQTELTTTTTTTAAGLDLIVRAMRQQGNEESSPKNERSSRRHRVVTNTTIDCSFVVQIMVDFENHLGIQESGCKTLRYLFAHHHRDAIPTPSWGWCMTVVVKALQRHRTHHRIQMNGYMALQALTIDSREDDLPDIDDMSDIDDRPASLLRLLFDTMNGWESNIEIQEQGLFAMGILLKETVAAAAGIGFVMDWGLSMIFHVLKTLQSHCHEDHAGAGIVQWGCWTLRLILLVANENFLLIRAILETNGLAVIFNGMHRHLNHVGVQEQACELLELLLLCNTDNKQNNDCDNQLQRQLSRKNEAKAALEEIVRIVQQRRHPYY